MAASRWKPPAKRSPPGPIRGSSRLNLCVLEEGSKSWINGEFMIITPKLLLALGLVCALAALATWFVFLRPVPRLTVFGVITQRIFKPASTYWQYPTGIRDGFWTPAQIPIAECYVFAIKVEGQPSDAFFSLNTTAAKSFDVGQKVEIDYEERGVPLIWKRVYVMDMRRAEGH